MFDRINKLKFILWTILGIAGAVAITRFIFGLGVTTNLTDNTPWGFWIGFDVMGGVALAAGGFVIAAFNYIFRKEVMHPISRAAILTAFLGYLAVAIGLLFDLGLPWNIWHMIIFWNPHSPLFEVGWCVMLYLSVLTLEFAPVVLEKYPNFKLLKKIHAALDKVKIPLVILGIMLSTLHQSSLGSLFLAMPYKLHPLWYSPIIPIIFFVSAICLGFMMVMVESMSSSYLYRKDFESPLLAQLRKSAIVMILIYTALRFGDIFVRGAGVFLFDAAWGTYLFWIELGLSVILPLFLFIVSKNRPGFLYAGALIGVIGIVFNRLNVGGLTHLNNLTNVGDFYFPSWTEFAISAGVVSMAMLVFFFFIENFKVWEEKPGDAYADPAKKLTLGNNRTYFGPNKSVVRIKVTFAFVMAFALGFASISGKKLDDVGIDDSQARKARGGDTLYVDGNRDGYGVAFKHQFHIDKDIKCSSCHHMNLPGDEASGCYECHSNMYAASDAFNHDWHAGSDGANLNCYECHSTDDNKGNTFRNKPEFATALCVKCHENIIPADADVKVIKNYMTYSYVEAMHNKCITCHTESLEKDAALKAAKPDIDKCATCHGSDVLPPEKQELFEKRSNNRWVVVPPKIK